MIILGLHFGHDAAATIIRDGVVKSYVHRERFTRVKHALGIDINTVDLALRHARVTVREIDCVAVSSTQCIELLLDEPRIDIQYTTSDQFDRPMTLGAQLRGADHNSIAATGSSILLDLVYDKRASQTYLSQFYRRVFPEHQGRPRSQFVSIPWVDTFYSAQSWSKPLGLRELAMVVPVVSDRLRYGFHIPIKVVLDGHSIPGYAIHHHLAHAANSYYSSDFVEAAIMTHDGFGLLPGYHSGMYYLGRAEGIYPLGPHHLMAGYVYEHVSRTLGLGVVGGSGKLMGLAGYGVPRFFSRDFVGNFYDFSAKFREVSRNWVLHCRRSAQALDYDLGGYADPTQATSAVNADIAASTQQVFEATMYEAVEGLKRQLTNAHLPISNLCLSGGTALNCPSNSAIAASDLFEQVFIDPACDDSGIAVGAALAAYHSILGYPRTLNRTTPYLGHSYSDEEVDQALALVGSVVEVDDCLNPAVRAAADVAEGQIVAWFEGRSESGPRALGHRSILADARKLDNVGRVNAIKGREDWRPFGPAVLVEHAPDWFENVPNPSPFMLFNARVRSDLVPAVTHVDNTARLQTVDESCGMFFDVLQAFYVSTGVPVLLNTSFNGPGEPIVETPVDALRAFLTQGIDVLYLTGRRIIKAQWRP
jgi:carbamoyltransferase